MYRGEDFGLVKLWLVLTGRFAQYGSTGGRQSNQVRLQPFRCFRQPAALRIDLCTGKLRSVFAGKAGCCQSQHVRGAQS